MSSPERRGASERSRRRLLALVAVIAVGLAGLVGFEPGALFDGKGLRNAGDLASGLLSPDLSPSFLARIGRLAWESLLIGVLGTAMAIALALVLAYLAVRPPELPSPPGPRRWRVARLVRAAARLILALARSVPEIVWAFAFVRIFGLGPGAAVFAIALTFGGIIGKLYAELAEGVDQRAPRAMRAAGAGRLAVFIHGVVPQVRRQWIGYALFRLECAIRSASVLGIVGAGGLGSEIDLSVRYFQYDKLATALLAVLAFIIALELVSWLLRRAPARFSIAFFAIGTVVAVAGLSIPWSALTSGDALTQLRTFFGALTSPTLDRGFVVSAVRLVGQTVAIAAVATIMATAIALALAPLAARSAWRGTLQAPPGGRGGARSIALVGALAVRLLTQITRALPDLVWALIFVVWVGPGVTAGVLALTVHTIGVLGRLFADVLEEADPAGPRAIEAAGGSGLARYLYGVLPDVMPRLLSFSLFRFEVNVRAAAMIGFVGAGGLGDALHTAISLFHASDLATLMLVLFAAVALIDAGGDRLRQRLASRERV